MTGTDVAQGVDPESLLALLRSRRVVRAFAPGAVERGQLEMILDAARWASSASNNRIHRFLVVRDPARIALVKAMAPGMFSIPGALIAICTDLPTAGRIGVQLERDTTTWIDVGTAAMNMMIQAHALGLGTCPVTSLSKAGVEIALGLPAQARLEFVLQLGQRPGHPPKPTPSGFHPSPMQGCLVYWERYGVAEA